MIRQSLSILAFVAFLTASAIRAQSPPAYVTDEVGHGVCKGLNNRYQCAQASEALAIKLLALQVHREGPTLRIKLRNRKDVELVDSPPYRVSSLRGLICDRFYVIEFETLEGPGMYLLDMETGSSYGLNPSIPVPSPDGKWIIVVHSHSEQDSIITVFDIGPFGLRQRWSFIPDSAPSHPKWINSATVEITMNGKRCKIDMNDSSFIMHSCS